MSSTLGSAFGVAISAAIYSMISHVGSSQWLGTVVPFIGRQDNLAIRGGGMMDLLFNLLLMLLAVVSIIWLVPKDDMAALAAREAEEQQRQLEAPAKLRAQGHPPLGSGQPHVGARHGCLLEAGPRRTSRDLRFGPRRSAAARPACRLHPGARPRRSGRGVSQG